MREIATTAWYALRWGIAIALIVWGLTLIPRVMWDMIGASLAVFAGLAVKP